MLIEFSVENYRSIAERQTLSMVASNEKKMLDSNTFTVDNSEKIRLLKSAVLYGANASGKTNILRALYVLRDIILTSADQRQINDKLEVEPFRLDINWRNKPTKFEIIFIQDLVRYQYSIALDRNRIYEESLFAYPNKRSQLWYSREYDPQTNKYNWHFTSNLKGQKNRIKDFVRSNSLFLSHAAQNNHQQLTDVINWFYEKTYILDLDNNLISFPEIYTAYMCKKDPKNIQRIKRFIAVADIDIYDFDIKSTSFEEATNKANTLRGKEYERNFENIIKAAKADQIMLPSEDEPLQVYSVRTRRKLNNSEEFVDFAILDESMGTQRLFALIGPCLEALTMGKVIIIDELGKSLHPALSMLLAKTFNELENKHGAQLLFTTHDTTLLDKTIFRRDQIWFTEKNEMRATQLYSLVEFTPTKNTKESLQKGYLAGRYGAVPFIGQWRF